MTSLESIKTIGTSDLDNAEFGRVLDAIVADPLARIDELVSLRNGGAFEMRVAAALAMLLFRQGAPVVSAAEYGVVADGVTDDAAAIQAAIDAAAAAGGGTVRLGPGTHLIGSKLELAAGVCLQGSGVPSTIIRGDDLTGVLVGTTVVAYAASPTIRAPQVRDLLIDNQDRDNAGGVGLDISGCYDALVENVAIQNCETGLRVTNSSYWNRFQGVRVTTTDTAILVTQNANHNTFVGCHAITTDVGVHVLEGADAGVSNTLFLHLAVEQFGTAGLGVHLETTTANAVDNVMLVQPRLENSAAGTTVGVTLTGTVRNATVIDPFFVNCNTNVSGARTDTTIRWRGQEKRGVRIGTLDDFTTTSHALLTHVSGTLYLRNDNNNAYLPLWVSRILYGGGTSHRDGTGSPEGVVAAPVGSTFYRTDGGTGTAFYVKETGGSTSTGWVAK